MVWLILGAGLVLGIAILSVALWPVMSRLPELRRAVSRLQHRLAETDRLQRALSSLQDQLAGAQRRAALTTSRIEAIKGRRAR